jgi:RNA polymerase sigma-70 factor (ECF subfamily)
MREGARMEEERRLRLSAWVTRTVLPCEHLVRAWLARSMVSKEDSDDLIQEAYCRLAGLDSFEQIARPDGFFFQIVRNQLLTKLRRANVVRIETVAELDYLNLTDGSPSPERAVGAKRDLDRVLLQIDALPERCRQAFKLRRIDGLSQREIAERLGVSENVVEHDIANALKLVIKALRQDGNEMADEYLKTRLR